MVPQNERSLRRRIAGWLTYADERMPLGKFFGFGLWTAWFNMAYKSSVWVDASVEATASVVSEMFLLSTIAHMVALILFVATYRTTARIAQKPWFIICGGLVGALGCIVVILAGPSFVPSVPLFYLGGALTGAGTAVLCLNSGIVLCSEKPMNALQIIVYCEILSAAMQFIVLGLPVPLDLVLFIVLPFLSAACFLLGSGNPKITVSETERLKPVKPFGRFLVTVGILSIVANINNGTYQISVSPVQLATDGNIANFIAIICLIVILIYVRLQNRELHFGHLFYPLAVFLIISLMASYLFPASAAFGTVLSGVAFQLFDVVMWYVFVCIVYQAKTSSIFVVMIGRAVISASVTMGHYLGLFCVGVDTNALSSTVVFVTLFVATIAIFFILPEKQVDKLLLPIPDDDSPEAQEKGDDAERKTGAWKQLCLQYADENLLTDREKEVFLLLARGYGAQSISDKLTVSLYTTRAHIRNIYTKIDIHSRTELSNKLDEYVAGASINNCLR